MAIMKRSFMIKPSSSPPPHARCDDQQDQRQQPNRGQVEKTHFLRLQHKPSNWYHLAIHRNDLITLAQPVDNGQEKLAVIAVSKVLVAGEVRISNYGQTRDWRMALCFSNFAGYRYFQLRPERK
jgi:hypothetical protein